MMTNPARIYNIKTVYDRDLVVCLIFNEVVFDILAPIIQEETIVSQISLVFLFVRGLFDARFFFGRSNSNLLGALWRIECKQIIRQLRR